MMSEYSGFILINRTTLGPYIFVGCHRMSVNSDVGLDRLHRILFLDVNALCNIRYLDVFFFHIVLTQPYECLGCRFSIQLSTFIGISYYLFSSCLLFIYLRRVLRYQRGNQNPHIEEEQTKKWPNEKGQKDKQRTTKHTYETKDRVTRNPLKTTDERRCSGRASSSCSTSNIRRFNLVTNPVISHE